MALTTKKITQIAAAGDLNDDDLVVIGRTDGVARKIRYDALKAALAAAGVGGEAADVAEAAREAALDAQAAVQDVLTAAEAARDLAQAAAADAAMVSGVAVPIYYTLAGAAVGEIPGGVQSILIQNRNPSPGVVLTMKGRQTRQRIAKADLDAGGYPASAWHRSEDRLTPAGIEDAVEGGYWLLSEPRRTPAMFGARGGAWHGEAAATIAAGSNVLTIAGRPSSLTDVGKEVMILGAGAAGVMMWTTVTGSAAGDYLLADDASTSVEDARVMIGWDDTQAINDGLTMGRLYDDGDSYLYTDTLWTDVEGGGIVGAGMVSTWFMTLVDLDRHMVGVYNAPGVVWTDFGAIGPFSFDGSARYNRLVNMGHQADLSSSAPTHWNARGCRMERVFATGYTVILDRSRADYSYYGELYGREICGVLVDPGGYGVTSSASHTRDGAVHVVNTISKLRHVVYHRGDVNDTIAGPMFIDGAALSSYQCRVTPGGGDSCGFVSLHTVNSGDDDTVSEVAAATWTRDTSGGPVITARNPIGGHTIMEGCKGYAVLVDAYPDGDLGTYEVKNHQGWGAGATLKTLCRIKPGSHRLTARILGAELNDSAARGWTVEGSQGVRIEMEIGGTYGRLGNTVDDCTGSELVAYPRSKPATLLFSFTGAGGAIQRIGNLKEVTLTDASGLTPSVFGARVVNLNYSAPALLTNFTDMYTGHELIVVPLNANVTFDQGGGTNQFNLQGGVDKATQTRIPLRFMAYTGRTLQL